MSKCLHNLPSQRLVLKALEKLKIQNKIKCELCIYKHKIPNYYVYRNSGKMFQEIFLEKKKNLKT